MTKSEPQPSIQRIAELQQFIADFAKVERMPQLADSGRRENDVEHSFGLALTCWFLHPKVAPELNLSKILQYALAHDTVEIHAGDTFTFGPSEEIASKSDREDAALERLRTDWPDFTSMNSAASAYKNKIDDEAKYVYAVDKLLPVIMVNLGEKDIFWSRHKVTLQDMVNNKRKVINVSPHMQPYFQKLVEWISDPNYFYKEA
jgi:5'-deoxynucleotidase YfbR-like HD superfamily hydrolase